MSGGNFGGGTGTLANPFLIEDSFDVNAIRNNTNAHYRLVNHIDMQPFLNMIDSVGFAPIPVLRGTLDGDGFAIKNLFINRLGAASQALFNELRRGQIRNLGLINCNIRGGANTGAFASFLRTSSCLIENCFSTGSVMTSVNSPCGGIVSHIENGIVRNCYTLANVNSSVSNATLGGIAGRLQFATARIQNCFTASRVTSITAFMNGITSSIADGALVENSYFDSTINPLSGTHARTTAQMQTPSTFVGWDQDLYNHLYKVWNLKEGAYPDLCYNEARKYLIFVGGEYRTFLNGAWQSIGTSFPTEAQFIAHGIHDSALENISKTDWNELRLFGSFELIASTDKFKVNRLRSNVQVPYDRLISDGVILRQQLNFINFGDAIFRINFV